MGHPHLTENFPGVNGPGFPKQVNVKRADESNAAIRGIPAADEGRGGRPCADNSARMRWPVNPPHTLSTPIARREFTFVVRRTMQRWISGEITLGDAFPAIRASDGAPGDASTVPRQPQNRGNRASVGSPAEAPPDLAGPRSPAAAISGRAIAPPPDVRCPRLESRSAAASWPRRPSPLGDSAHAGQSGKTPGPRPSFGSAPACVVRPRAVRRPGAWRETSLLVPCRTPATRRPGRSGAPD